MADPPSAPTARPLLHDQETLLPRAQIILVVSVLGLILAVVNIDANGLSTALPTIAADLHATDTISWAGTASLIGATVLSVLLGRFSDIFGRRPLFLAACLLFTASQLICSFAVNGPMLYVGRALAGVAGGGLGNLAAIIASDIVVLEERGKYQGYCGAFIAMGNIAGPFLAAGLTDGATWRAFFWMLAPLGVVCAGCAWWFLPATDAPGPFVANLIKVDWIGSLLSTTTIVLFLIPISGGGFYYTWDSALVISMLTIAGVSFFGFLFWEIRFAPLPLIPMSMFRDRSVVALLAQAFILGWVVQSCTLFLPLYYQNLRSYSPIASAALLTPIIGTQVVVSVSSGRWISKKRHYGGVIRLGIAISLVGTGLMIVLDRNTPPAAIVFILIPIGIAAGTTGQPLIVALQAHTKKSFRAVVTSCRNFVRFLGAACGIVVSSATLQSSLQSGLPPDYKYIAKSVYSLPPTTPESKAVIAPAYETAIRNIFITNTALAALGVILLFFWQDQGLQRAEHHEDNAMKETEPTTKASFNKEEKEEAPPMRDLEKGDLHP